MEARLQELMAQRHDEPVPCSCYRNWFDARFGVADPTLR